MAAGFGQYDTGGGSGVAMKGGVYQTRIKKADVKRSQGGEIVKDRSSGKVKFELITDVVGPGPRHRGEPLKRTMTVSFGANNETGQYATFARFIQAATGIPCGDPRQKDVTSADLEGQLLDVMVKHENAWNNIIDFLDREEDAAAVETERAPATQTTNGHAAAPRPSEIPPASGEQLAAIGKICAQKKVGTIVLERMIEDITEGRSNAMAALNRNEAGAVITALNRLVPA